MEGLMLVVDGGNGAGKSTVLRALEQHLQSKNLDVVMTREPGGTDIGEQIRSLLLSSESLAMSDVTELLLFAAARAQHLHEKILPALKEGRIVISDRFDSATVSFQHFARGLSLDLINSVNQISLGGFQPDLTIILDLDPRIGLLRTQGRSNVTDRFELEAIEFLDRARTGYLIQAEQKPDRFLVIDAGRGLDEVVADVVHAVSTYISKKHNY